MFTCLDNFITILSGKDAVKIFSLHHKIIERIPESFSKKRDFKLLFATLNLIFSKTRLNRFLSPREISDLELNVINLSTIISMKFSKMSITVKMHDILGKP